MAGNGSKEHGAQCGGLFGHDQFAGTRQAQVVLLALMQQDHLLSAGEQISYRDTPQRWRHRGHRWFYRMGGWLGHGSGAGVVRIVDPSSLNQMKIIINKYKAITN